MVLSRTRVLPSLIVLFFGFVMNSQTVEFPYAAANISWYSGNLYCFGLEEQTNGKVRFAVQKLGKNLETLGTQSFLLPFQITEEKVSCWSDTLHGYLNIYVSEGRTQKVSLFRFGRNFELLNQSSGVEVSRLNVLSGFDNELYYESSRVYAIKTKSDSSGTQFFLNKYTYKENPGGFEYDLLWQFPFERKNIASARVFHANKEAVWMYVMVKAGEKTGQWILKVNAKNGHLLKGTKLNEKGDEKTYCFGNYYYEPSTKSLIICGHKFSPKQLPPGLETLSIAGSTAVTLYLSEMDSLGVQVLKQELILPLVVSKTSGKNPGHSYLLQIDEFSKTGQNQYRIEADVYQKNKATPCYTYANTFSLLMRKEEERYLPEKKNISSEPMIETYLLNNDRLDMNGKLCLDSGTTLSKLFYKRPSLSVKLNYAADSLSRPLWFLSKSNIRKGNINYSLLQAGKKTYELKTLEEISKSARPICIPLPPNRIVIGRQVDSGVYKLILYRH